MDRLTPLEGRQAPGGGLWRETQRQGSARRAPVVTGRFHAYPSEVLKPVSQRPRDLFPSLKDRVLLGPLPRRRGCQPKSSLLVWVGMRPPFCIPQGQLQKGQPLPQTQSLLGVPHDQGSC